MIRGEFPSAGERDPARLREAYDDVLADVVEEVGAATVAERTGVDSETLRALVEGDRPNLELADAAAILATDPDRPDADAVAAEARDILLMGMTSAVLDVEALASEVDDELEPKEIQQKVEGRYPITLDEFALLHSAIEGRRR